MSRCLRIAIHAPSDCPRLRPRHDEPRCVTQGENSIGTGGGSVDDETFTVGPTAGEDALNYNFGERPAATGSVKNGQALIKALNGGQTSHRLGDWLAATLPHMFGAQASDSNLAGKTNAYISTFFQSRFVLKDQKLDAQVLATALAVYVTNATLDVNPDGTDPGSQYGFVVSGNRVTTATFNVGSNGVAFGVADNTVMTVLDLLLAVDAQAVNGVLYNGDKARRDEANNVFGAINQAGGL